MPMVSVCSVTGEHTYFKMQPLEPYYNMPLCRRHVLFWVIWPAYTPNSRNNGQWPFLPSPRAPVEGMVWQSFCSSRPFLFGHS